jgi:hypothetical protein
MKRPRGLGSTYQRGGVWWVVYHDSSHRRHRESSGSKNRTDALHLLIESCIR